jgi:hypothetical protein
VPANCTISIPVSCVEAGRWHHVSERFGRGRSASYAVRREKLDRVQHSLSTRQRHDADQASVWRNVRTSLAMAASSSPTEALHDAYQARQSELQAFRGSVQLPPAAVGVAVFRGRQFLGLDLFDRHRTLRYFWDSLLDSYAIDWVLSQPDSPEAEDAPDPALLAQIMARCGQAAWQPFKSPGEGADHRLVDDQYSGCALVWEDKVVVHLQVMPRPAEALQRPEDVPQSAEPPVHRRPPLHRRWADDSRRRGDFR